MICSLNNHLQFVVHVHIGGPVSSKGGGQALGFSGTGFYSGLLLNWDLR